MSVGSFLASAPFTMYSGFSFSKGAGGEWALAGGDNPEHVVRILTLKKCI